LFVLGGGLVIFSLLSGFEASKKPYIWPLWLNLLYFGLNRYLYVIGAMIILFVILMKHFRGGQKLIGNKFMRFLAKITFIGGLISPIIIYDLYLGGERPILMTDRGNLVIGLGNIICISLTGIPLYLAVEYPLKKLSEATILDRISHHELLRKHYEGEGGSGAGAGQPGPKPFNIQE
jgi:peptidoglycan/LPS O-acetylase OafA/YrhL